MDCSPPGPSIHGIFQARVLEWVAIAFSDTVKVVILTHEAATSGRERVQGFLDTIGGHEGIEVVEKVPCEGQLEIAMPQMEKLIEQGKEFDSVFCLNDPSSLGAAAALETKGLLDKVDIYGIDASPDAKQLIYEGKMRASVAQFPSRIGEEAANAIYDLLDGKEVKSYISVPEISFPDIVVDPMDCSPPGPSIHGIFQARVLEWGAIAFSDTQSTS